MTKKMWDILPPKTSLPSHDKEIREISLEKEEIVKKTKIKKGWLLTPLFFVILAVFYFKVSSAEIKIWPVTEVTYVEAKLIVDADVKEIDFEKGIIPGSIFESEETVSGTFPSTGKAFKKAEGVISLCNAYTTKSEEWWIGTRFMSAEGKTFKSKAEIPVPGAEIKDNKLVAKCVDVPVIAAPEEDYNGEDYNGEDYNIGPSNFSIVSFRGTQRYTKFYGESFEPMRGGGKSLVVTEEHLEKAKESLVKEIEIKAANSLEEKIGEDFVLLEDTLKTEITESLSLIKVGDEMESFNFRVNAKLTGIIFEKKDVDLFTENFILAKAGEGKVVHQKSLNIGYTPQVVDLEAGRLVVYLNVSASIYSGADLAMLKSGLAGKSLAEARFFLQNQPGILNTELNFSPFWVNSIPKDLSKVKIEYPIIE